MRFQPLCLCLLLFANACGSATPSKEVAQPEPEAPRSSTEFAPDDSGRAVRSRPRPAAPPPERPGSAAAEERAAESSGDFDLYGRDEYRRTPSRPGLGTRWGEERDSQVREVFFERQRSRPAGVVSVHYDDEVGVASATGRHADDAYPRTFAIGGGSLTVSITDDDGDPLPSLYVGGTDYVIGEAGDRYQIEVKNHTAGRFEIVASVDGLDVLDGGDGSFDKRGYLVSPWSTLTIEGFRDSYETVRAFRFGDVEESYAVQRGKGRNVGVIGVAVFEERGFRWGVDDDELRRRRNANPFPSRFAPAP